RVGLVPARSTAPPGMVNGRMAQSKPDHGEWVGSGQQPETKRRILEAAAEVFSEKGYYATAVDDIVRASDTSKGSFYHFFPNKQGIFLSLVDHIYSVLLRRVEGAIERERGALNKVDAALRTVLGEFARHRRLARLLLIE